MTTGADDSNTNAKPVRRIPVPRNIKADGSGVQVIGVPKTIDGDLQIGDLLPISFGFDTATKVPMAARWSATSFSQPPLPTLAFSVKLMKRSPHGLRLKWRCVNSTGDHLISEEIAEKRQSLSSIVNQIAHTVVERADKGDHHGVVIIPEGVIESIPRCTR